MELSEATAIVDEMTNSSRRFINGRATYYIILFEELIGSLNSKLEVGFYVTGDVNAPCYNNCFHVELKLKKKNLLNFFKKSITIGIPNRFFCAENSEVAEEFSYWVSNARHSAEETVHTQNDISIAKFIIFLYEHFGIELEEA